MDNFEIDVSSEGRQHFDLAMAIACRRPAVGWAVLPDHGLVLYWDLDSKSPSLVNRLPSPMDAKAASDFVWHWLENTAEKDVDFNQCHDHDGYNARGWRVYCEAWGQVAGDWRAFVAVRPIWALYGK